MRLATADWFSRWFFNRPGATVDSELIPERPEDIRCTQNGSIRYSKEGETVWTTAWGEDRGDLVFFSTTDPGPSHVAIAVNIDEFVHAPSSSGVVRVERINSRYWMPRVVGIRRLTTRE